MRKWILVLCLSLAFVFGLALTVQAREITSFQGDNLGQIKLAVLREGPKGGEPVLVDDHLRVTGYLNIDTGIIVREKPGGKPVIIGDHLRVDGWLFANVGIVRGTPGEDPVIIADHLRVEGEISRAAGPVKVKDDLEVTKSLNVKGVSNFTGQVTVKKLKVTEKLELASTLDVSKANIVGAEAKTWLYFRTPGKQIDQWCPSPCTWYALNDGFVYMGERFFPIPFRGRLTKLTVYATQGPDSGNSHTITIRKNGIDTAMQVTLSAGQTEGSSTVVVEVQEGDKISIKNTVTGGLNTWSAQEVGIVIQVETDVT